MKFWITDQDEIVTFKDNQEHDQILADQFDLRFYQAIEQGWIRGSFVYNPYYHENKIYFEGEFDSIAGDLLKRIDSVIDQIPEAVNAKTIGIDPRSGNYVDVPMDLRNKIGLEKAYNKAKNNPVMAFNKSALKFWITPKDEIFTFSGKEDHYDYAESIGIEPFIEGGWIRGWTYKDNTQFEFASLNPQTINRIERAIEKISETASTNLLVLEYTIAPNVGYIDIPMKDVEKMGLQRALNKAKKQPVFASKKDKLLDEIRLGNWNAVQDMVKALQEKMTPEEFEKNLSPLSISIELVKLMGKAGIHFAKEYADNVWEMHRDSVFTDGLYTLDRNKSGVPFEMEPTSGPYPRGLMPVQKAIGDIAPIDRISSAFNHYSGWITTNDEFIDNEGYAHVDIAKQEGFGGIDEALDKGWIRVSVKSMDKISFEFENLDKSYLKRIRNFLENNPDTAGYEFIDLDAKQSDGYIPNVSMDSVLRHGIQSAINRAIKQRQFVSLHDLTADFQTKPSWKGWIPPKAPMTLYHATAVDNMKSIHSKGLLPFGESSATKQPAVWMSDKPDFAINHFKNRFPGKKGVLLKLLVNPEICGLHQAMIGYPNVYVCHEVIPPDMIIEEISLDKKSFSLRDLVASNENKVWITPEDEVIGTDPFNHQTKIFHIFNQLGRKETLTGNMSYGQVYDLALEEDWIRVGESSNWSELYFEVNHLNDKNIDRIQKYIDEHVADLSNKKFVLIDYDKYTGNKKLSAEDVEKYGLKSALKRQKKSFSLEHITRVAIKLREHSKRTGDVLDNLKPLVSLWYENEDGEKYILSDEELKNAEMPDDYPYQHSRNPELRDTVCIENAPPLMEGGTTMNCIGPIVIALVQNKGWDWVDALTFAASTCERCLNILLEETTGEPYDGRETSTTWCECCEMIDPEYDNHYKTVIQPEQDKNSEEAYLDCVGFKDLVASSEYNRVWITDKDEVLKVPSGMTHAMYLNEMYDTMYVSNAAEKGWIRKGENPKELYFSVADLDPKMISRIQKYIDNNPESLLNKENVAIDSACYRSNFVKLPAEDVEKYGLKSAIQRSKRQLVNAFSLVDLFREASESLMLTPKNTDLAPQSDWRYPERQEPSPTGFRPFMTDSPPGPKLKETTEDSHIFFFGPSFNQNLTKIKKD